MKYTAKMEQRTTENIQRKTPKLVLSLKAQFGGTVGNFCRQKQIIKYITTIKNLKLFFENK